MRIVGINGSPRKNWNTATLIEKALDGARSQGAETELVHLYDLNFIGCKSCFACKTLNGKNFGKCGVKDDITPILDSIVEIDAVILGSPIYFGTATGKMRMFMERLLFPFLTYNTGNRVLYPKKIKTGLIYTMNLTESKIKNFGYEKYFSLAEYYMDMVFGSAETLLCTDTYQFKDYSKMAASKFDPEHKARRREEVFPVDCQKAYELGIRLTEND
jgi:multimeric flavodoxin WrbA